MPEEQTIPALPQDSLTWEERAQKLEENYRKALINYNLAIDKLRSPRTTLTEEIAQLDANFQRTYADELLEETMAEEYLEACRNDLQNLAVKYYDETKEKTLDQHLSVRVDTKLEYEIAKAVEWAEKNAPFVVTKGVDTKAFNAIAATQKLDFVTKKDTTVPVIKGLK